MTTPIKYHDFAQAIGWVKQRLRTDSETVDTRRWQSTTLPDHPMMKMREVFNVSFTVEGPGVFNVPLDVYRTLIHPNLPWADVAFEERVSGVPWNPGKAWESWPWAGSANAHRTEGERFSHSYAERYWPKFAGVEADSEWYEGGGYPSSDLNDPFRRGIRYAYGDLNDVVAHLAVDPLSRQAYLPVWFPEDTGVVHGARVPCSLGYHFLHRGDRLHITYYIRSCDFIRHFRDDIYMSVRLQLWMLERLKDRDSRWEDVRAGDFVFHCASLHCFEGDYVRMFGGSETTSPNT